MALPKPEMECITKYKPIINIGALMDIPNGFFIKGQHGETLTMGGLPHLSGIVGGGNSFKSTIMHYMLLSASNKILATTETSITTYDTEVNIHQPRLEAFASRFEYLRNHNLFEEGIWMITDKTIYYADKWFERIKTFLKAKKDGGKDSLVKLPFSVTPDGKAQTTIVPTFTQIDSLSELVTSDVAKICDENELGESGGNTVYMRQGLAKTRMLMELPYLTGNFNHYVILTAHMGKDNTMQQGPYAQMPTKKLPHMKMGDKIKGVTDKFFFLMNSCWHVTGVQLLTDKEREVMYPGEGFDMGTDLHLVTMKQLRSKSGASGNSVEIVVSQVEGVLEHLTLFHYIKEANRFGLEGNKIHYNLSLLPEVKLQRTNVRDKIKNDDKLKRALEITADVLQIYQHHPAYRHLAISPDVLYKTIADLGYDWNMILSKTRSWWTVNESQEAPNTYFLSTMDLLLMAKQQYHPYWLEDDKRTIKKEFRKSADQD